MGSVWGRSPPWAEGDSTPPPRSRVSRRKRSLEEGSEEEVEELSPKRRKIQATSSYIYETLFKKGMNSDVTIIALGKEWKLHKLYLSQSDYFSSMFSGNWKESTESQISMNIPDPNITVEALDLAFSSLYRDDVHLTETEICSTVAAASMLQMEGLLEHCTEFMRETLQAENVIPFLTTSAVYGLRNVEEECTDWLMVNLLRHYSITLLKNLSPELLRELLESPDLYVMQVEMDVYTLAKRWLFLVFNPDATGDCSKLTADAETYFKNEGRSSGSFLEREAGLPYVEVFRAIRLQHILNDSTSIETIEADKIIPQDWLVPLYRQQWLKMLMVDQRLDPGPSGLNCEQFNSLSFRCGRVLHEPAEYCWRWTGFSFGFDVLLLYEPMSGVIAVKRNTRTQPCVSSVSLQPKRTLAIRLRVASYGPGGDLCTQDSGILRLNLSPDEECHLVTISNTAQFPLYISVNLALTSLDKGQPSQDSIDPL